MIWVDKDKKGRKRERDFKTELKSLKAKKSLDSKHKSNIDNHIDIELQSFISPLGKNIKPEYIKYWLEAFLGNSLKITNLKRTKLILKRC